MGKIGYLGPKATFTHQAVQSVFPNEDYIPYKTIPACIDAVAKGDVSYGVVPLENTLEGSVNLTLNYLIHETRMPIVGEIVLPIRQHLMVHPQNEGINERLEAVYSHPHAIAQCHKFLYQHLSHADIHETSSTAWAAQYIQAHPERKIAAIANELAAAEYGLTIAKGDIHDYSHNHTRFVVLHKELDAFVPFSKEDGEKTTLLVQLPADDQSGSLHQVLSAFAWRRLNLSKIESRPMKTGLGNYFFIIDIEQKLDDVLIPGAISELEALGCTVSILGTYAYQVME
ncbi:prephenate dehydratase [Priestia koreensis]|uniref:prephenate dehydratase n=1 Tax=Priestia koreensis TaxID=284581 RepID=UPI00203E4914|nr:prephenate dehydratase [Priestia koreensis]MCM3002632.1 prephenate dehydratase [Priestia koreensis]